MISGKLDLPSVVLEVDHTADIRRGKLRQYEAWRFPEVWVEALDRPCIIDEYQRRWDSPTL